MAKPMTKTALETQAARLLAVETEYWQMVKKLEGLKSVVTESTLPVVCLKSNGEPARFTVGPDKNNSSKTVVAQIAMGHQALAQIALKDLALGQDYYETSERVTALAKERFELFQTLVPTLQLLPGKEKWDRPASVGLQKSIAICKGMRADYLAISTGYKSRVCAVWCFDGFGY